MGNIASGLVGASRLAIGSVPRAARSGQLPLTVTGAVLCSTGSSSTFCDASCSADERQAASSTKPSVECAECFRRSARVFCGGEHTLVRDPHTLEVYQLGACGLGFDHDHPPAGPTAYLRKVPLPGPASLVAAGYYHNLFKLVGGRCFSYGCGRQAPNDGQLMNGSEAEETFPTATQMRFAEAIAGGHHSVCRTSRGEAWTCGAGWQGQMGDGSLQYKNPEPKRLPGVPRIRRLAGGYYHNAALGEDGEWYIWGCNEQEQLGPQREGRAQLTSPLSLSEAAPDLSGLAVQDIDGGYGHTALLLEDGRVLTMGNCSDGQRGLDPEADDAPAVSEVPGLPGPAEAIAAGNHHTLVVVHGRLFAFGSDEYGQVGGVGAPPEDDDHRRWRPQPVSGLPADDPVVRVSAGICHSAAQTASGRVFVWGCGSNGQLGDAALPASGATREVDIEAIVRQCKVSSVDG